MRKLPSASAIADKLHRGFVLGCIGLTAYGLVLGGTRFYHYITVIRPSRLAIKEKLLAEDLPNRPDPEELKS